MNFIFRVLIRASILVLFALVLWQILTLVAQRQTPEELNLSKEDAIVKLEDDHFNTHRQDKIKIKIYYEALCPDSRHFIIHNAVVVADSLNEFTTTALVPYGKATTTITKSGEYIFDCQHGPTECYANKIHACSIQALSTNETRAVEIVACMIDDNQNPDGALKRCATRMQLDDAPIRECANSQRGSELLKMYGDETKAIEPLSFIPTITLNGSSDDQMAILKNMKKKICKLIGMPLPPACLSL